MTGSKWFLHNGRALEVRHRRVMTDFQIWIYEDDRPLDVHGVVSLREASAGLAEGRDVLGQAMEAAIADIQAGRLPLTSRPLVVAAE